jgi:MoaA/NifB/PqqE/SkfB family radical SAM enzyme
VRAFIDRQRAREAIVPAVSLWFTAMRENLHELPALVDLAGSMGIREIYLQRLVYFEKGLARSAQSLFRRSTPEELALVGRCEQACRERGMTFKAAGIATPVESLQRDFGERPWSGCGRPYASTYITSGGNVLSCCFAPFGHTSALEYREERVLGNVFEQPVGQIWRGTRYQAFRRAFESGCPPVQCSECGLGWSY